MRLPRKTLITRIVLPLFAVLCALVPTTVAHAQFGLGSGFGDAFQPDFVRRDLQIANEALRLDEAQRWIVESLFDDYETTFEEGKLGVQEELATISQQIDPSDVQHVMSIVFAPIEKWATRKEAIGQQLMLDIQNQLTDEQRALWPAFERKVFRLKNLGKGRLEAENVDLIAVLDQIVPQRAIQQVVAQPVGEYDVMFDEALRRREAHTTASQTKMMMIIQDRNEAAGLAIVDEQLALRKAVRDVNERYAAIIAGGLPAELGASFYNEVMQRAYPRIFRPTRCQRMIEATLEITDLEASVRAAVVALKQQFEVELNAINTRLVDVTKAAQSDDAREKFLRRLARMDNRPRPREAEDAVRDTFRQRDDMEQRYMAQLRALLTPEQYQELPGVGKEQARGLSTTGDPMGGTPGRPAGNALNSSGTGQAPGAPGRALPSGERRIEQNNRATQGRGLGQAPPPSEKDGGAREGGGGNRGGDGGGGRDGGRDG